VEETHDDRLTRLVAELNRLRFELSGRDAERLRVERDRLSRLVTGVVRRTDEPRAPLLLVVGGGSGAGKSTTVNTLARRAVTETGVVRPTTRVPTLVCHPEDRAWFDDDRVLPDLARAAVPDGRDAQSPPETALADVTHAQPRVTPAQPGVTHAEADVKHAHLSGRQLRLAVSDHLPLGIALLDTPDIDSVEVANHLLADESLDAADVWVWLATSRTYADEVGMGYLRRASIRQALSAIAITQVRPHERDEVLADVDRLLLHEGVDPVLRVEIPFDEVTDGRLPDRCVEALREWLTTLAPTDRRVAIRQRAVAGLRAAIPHEVVGIVAAAERELEVADRLTRSVTARFDAIPTLLDAELDAGLSLRAEVLDRWQQLVGSGEAMLKVQTTATQLADVIRAKLGQPSRDDTRRVQVEVADELTRSVTRLLDGADRAARNDLEADPVGRDVLGTNPALRAEHPERTSEVRRAVAEWEAHVAELVSEVGGSRRTQARRATTAINAVATSAILVLFALSGGLTGGEVGIAAAAAGASQWLLLKLFGEHNLRQLLSEIRNDLLTRVGRLAAAEGGRYAVAIDAASPPPDAVAAVRAAGAGRSRRRTVPAARP
jgi:hypothetical protein